MRGQKLVDHDGLWCDVLIADDGLDYWFDVSDLIGRRPASDGGQGMTHKQLSAGWPA